MNLDKKMEFWIKNKYNVLFKGKHGCGKSTIIIDAFNKSGLKWLYFSCPTLDSWTDFCGIPKETKDEKGNSYIDFIRPKYMQEDNVEAIFLDEFNRAPKKIKNSVLELIQFKSINGKKFNNLKVVWAAINPDDDSDLKYDVEELDPAQKDRFHVIVDIPYIPDALYFKNKYGEEMAEVAITWWKEMDTNIKNDISPRRLDYALDLYKAGGDIRDVLPAKANINKLFTELTYGSITKKLGSLFETKNEEESKKFLLIENNFVASQELIIKTKSYLDFFLPLMLDEKISALISNNNKVFDHVLKNFDKFQPILKEILNANSLSKDKIKKIKTEFIFREQKNTLLPVSGAKNIKRLYNKKTSAEQFSSTLDWIIEPPTFSTQDRLKNYQLLDNNLSMSMTSQDAQKSIKILGDIILHSHDLTINTSYKNIVPMLNHVILTLQGNNIAPIIEAELAVKLKQYPEYIANITQI